MLTCTHTLSITDPLRGSYDLFLSALLCNVQDLLAGHEPKMTRDEREITTCCSLAELNAS